MALTNEDKIAIKLAEELDRMSLDLDKVGRVFAHVATNVAINRLEVVLDSAIEEKGEMYVRYAKDTLYK